MVTPVGRFHVYVTAPVTAGTLYAEVPGHGDALPEIAAGWAGLKSTKILLSAEVMQALEALTATFPAV